MRDFSIKEWAKANTIKICTEHYELLQDQVGNLVTPEGKQLKVVTRDSKPVEDWAFSITIAMVLSSVVDMPAEMIATHIGEQLTKLYQGSWQFCSCGAYVNAYFLPRQIEDYLKNKEFPSWADLKGLKNGEYAYYRLNMIFMSLEARGLKLDEETPANLNFSAHPLHQLFSTPDLPVSESKEGVKQWEAWLEGVTKLTQRGDLRELSQEMEIALLTFIKACLKR